MISVNLFVFEWIIELILREAQHLQKVERWSKKGGDIRLVKHMLGATI